MGEAQCQHPIAVDLYLFILERKWFWIVTGDSNAQNGNDGDASALLNETFTSGSSMTENYTYVLDKNVNIGTLGSFSNMQSASDGGAFAALTEVAAVTNRTNRTSNPGKVIPSGTQFGSYTPSNLNDIDGAIDITIRMLQVVLILSIQELNIEQLPGQLQILALYPLQQGQEQV